MKVTLTRNQAEHILDAVRWGYNENYPASDPDNQCYIRLEKKFKKMLEEN